MSLFAEDPIHAVHSGGSQWPSYSMLTNATVQRGLSSIKALLF